MWTKRRATQMFSSAMWKNKPLNKAMKQGFPHIHTPPLSTELWRRGEPSFGPKNSDGCCVENNKGIKENLRKCFC
jgi:hypothetical protein